MKIDFRKIKVREITGEMTELDLAERIGNIIYYNVYDIKIMEIGLDIYKNGEIEIERDLASELIDFLCSFSQEGVPVFRAVFQEAFRNILKEE